MNSFPRPLTKDLLTGRELWWRGQVFGTCLVLLFIASFIIHIPLLFLEVNQKSKRGSSVSWWYDHGLFVLKSDTETYGPHLMMSAVSGPRPLFLQLSNALFRILRNTTAVIIPGLMNAFLGSLWLKIVCKSVTPKSSNYLSRNVDLQWSLLFFHDS